jgi:hypothetical protein
VSAAEVIISKFVSRTSLGLQDQTKRRITEFTAGLTRLCTLDARF